jgi:LacI family transcriptional regulator
VTIQADIARAAKVSTATVSRVLNNSPLVREEVRARVNSAMDELGYFPHGAARALVLKRSWTIGAIVPTLDSDIFARSINSLMNTLRQSEYTLIVASSAYSQEAEKNLVRRLLERGVDGLFLVGTKRLPETVDLLKRSGKPYVNTYISGRSLAGPTIGFSNRAASAALVDHLVALGHRSIGMFAGIGEGNDRAAERLAGARARLKHHGLTLQPSATLELRYAIQPARTAFRALAEAGKLPTALICGNDVIAMGVMFEAAALGVAIPAQLSVAGFDNHPLTAHITPSLTTIDVPADQMGAIAADALVTAIAKGTPIPDVVLPAPLLIRGTTAAAAKTKA